MTSAREPRPGVPWATFEAAAPQFARFVHARLDAHRHRYMATIRADGSPRIGGIELTIVDGELWVGGLDASRKFDDLRRDPRLALHSGSDDPPAFGGDARVSGRAVFVEDDAVKARFLEAAGGGPPGPFELIRVELEEVSTIEEAPSKDHLVVSVWRPGSAVRRMDRW